MKALFVVAALSAAAHASPTVPRQSVRIQAVTFHDADWVPKIDAVLVGDPAGPVTATFTKPDGTVWGSAELRVDDGDDRKVHPASNGMLDPDKLSAATTGVFKVTINDGKTALFTGSFKVAEVGKGKFSVDHDWITSANQIWWDASQHPDNPALHVGAWFKAHDVDCHDLAATLSFNGKPLAAAGTPDAGVVDSLRSTGDVDAARYIECSFTWDAVKPWVNGDYGDQMKAWHILAQHPGKYDVAITRGGAADRTISFTVDKSGMLARTGVVEAARHDYRMLAPSGAPAGSFYGAAAGPDAGVKAMYAERKTAK